MAGSLSVSALSACRPEDGLLTITALSALQACTGQQLELVLEASGGVGPFQWFSTSLPPDLVLEQNGTRRAFLRGALGEAGTFEAALGVRDAQNCAQLSLPVSVAQTPVLTTAWPSSCAGEPFELQLSASGGDPATYTWSYTGEAPLELAGARLFGRAPSEPGSYAVQIALRDARCPTGASPVVSDELWVVRPPGECPSVETAQLPAPCLGVPYRQALRASGGSGAGYTWAALSGELPSGLRLDAERGVIEGTPTGPSRSGTLELLLVDSQQQRATAALELTLREDCRLAWIGDEPARLHLSDVFLSQAAQPWPRQLEPGARVVDLKFSPDGAWLAFRAGVPGAERLRLLPARSATDLQSQEDSAVDFVCPDAPACAVLDYAWSRDSRHLAVVLGGSGARQLVSGITLQEGGAVLRWPVLDTVLADLDELPLSYVRDLSWAADDRFGFVGASGREDPPQTVFSARAGLEAAPQSAPYYDLDLRLRSTPAGWAVFDGTYYTTTAVIPPGGVALHSTAWLAPSGEYVATVQDAQLRVYAFGDGQLPLAASEPGACGVVVTWSPRAGGVERIVCSGGSLDTPDGTALRVFDFDVERRAFLPPAGRLVPSNGVLQPSPLSNTRRLFNASADWLLVRGSEGLVLTAVPSGSPELPRPVSFLPLAGSGEARFSPDGRSLLTYDANGLVWSPVPPRPVTSLLSQDEAGQRLAPPPLTTCAEALWASPDNWCGALAPLGHFVISGDSRSALFEADGALWVTDLGLAHEHPARRVAPLPACGASCATRYAFAP